MIQPPHITRFTLERILAGELDAGNARHHLEVCAECRQRADALQADRAAFAEEVPYARFRIEHERRVAKRGKSRRWRGWRWALAPTLVAAIGVAVLSVMPDDLGERSKGSDVALDLYGASGEPLPAGHSVAGGTRVQLAYDAGSCTFIALLGIDAAGTLTTYFPERGTRLAPLPSGEEGLFPFGLELDDALGVERFFLILADEPADLDPIVEAARSLVGTDLRRAAVLPLSPGLRQASVWLQKPEVP